MPSREIAAGHAQRVAASTKALQPAEEMNGKVKTTPRQFRAALLNLTSERRIIMIFEADGEARSSRLRKRSALRPRWPR